MTRVLLMIAIGFLILSAVNREYFLPQFRQQLTHTAQNWNESSVGTSHFQKDHLTGLLIRAAKIDPISGEIAQPVVQIPMHLSSEHSKIIAHNGRYLPENSEHPAGLLLERISEPRPLVSLPNLVSQSDTVVFFPKTERWLKPNQCFVATNLTLDDLAYGQDLNDYSSLPEMIESLQRPTQWYSRSNQITVHSRIVRPILDLTLLLLALPLVIRFSEENLMAAVGTCLGTILVFQISVMVCVGLGSVSLIPTASLTAWLPIMVFLPLSIWSWQLLEAT
ncbi:MAG: LptF/LptG family permease [Pirellulaceae bacterium]